MDAITYESTLRQHKDRVYSYAAWMLRNREEAKDLAQEAMIRLWEHREKVHEEAAKSWLLTTVHRLCLDRLRHRTRWNETTVDPADPLHISPEAGPERIAGAREAVANLCKAIGILGPEDRAVVLLREVEGMEYREIADFMNVPLGTLKARLHRARTRLRRELIGAGVTS